MTRALWFSVKLALLLALGYLLIEVFPGTAEVTWFGYEITMHVGVLLAGVVVFAGLAALIYNFWRFLRRAPAATADAFAASRKRRGFEALTRGMVAIAAGDPDEADRLAKKAEGLLEEPPLTMLLSAQAAQLQGDEDAARRYFEKMLENDETRFLGLRGLLRQSLRRNDIPAALTYTREAHNLRPDSPWVLTSLVDLNARQRNYREAETALELAIKHKAIDKAAAARQRAVVKTELARAALAAGDTKGALRQAKAAASLAPALVAAQALVAEAYDAQGKDSRAARHLEKNWHEAPHRDLATLYLKVRGIEQAMERFKALKRLVMTKPEAAESSLVLARAALAAKLWGEVRHYLTERFGATLPENAVAAPAAGLPDEEVCRLLAQVAEGETGDMAQARAWLARALEAPPAPVWLCRDCGAMAARWQAHCEACDAFDSLAWEAPHRAGPGLPGTAYLPLEDLSGTGDSGSGGAAAAAVAVLPAAAEAGARRRPGEDAAAPAVLEMAVCAPDELNPDDRSPAPKTELAPAQPKAPQGDGGQAASAGSPSEPATPSDEPEGEAESATESALRRAGPTASSGESGGADSKPAANAAPTSGTAPVAISSGPATSGAGTAYGPAEQPSAPKTPAPKPAVAATPATAKSAAELAEAELLEERARRFSEEGAAGN